MTSIATKSTLPSVGSPAIEPDAHGQAALLLVESLIHSLVENTTLTTTEAVLIVTTAAEVKIEVAEATNESRGRMQASLDLLSKIADSFKADQF